MKLGGSTIVMGGAWLVLSACSGSYEVGLEPSAGSAGTGVSSAGDTSSGGSSSGSLGNPPSAGTGAVGPGSDPAPDPNSTCGFAPSVPGGAIVPSVGSDEVAARVYSFLEGSDAPALDLPAMPSASWAASLATTILDAHFDAGTSVPGLERVLQGMLSEGNGPRPTSAPGVWAAKLADPDATLSTLLAEPTGEAHRLGVLTDREVLALHPSISPRGVWLMDKLFCQQVPASPPDIPALPPPQSGHSKRELLELQLVNPVCGACHQIMDPSAFSLEHFDNDGNYRELDNGVPVDSSGTISGLVTGQAHQSMSFDNFEDLAPQLAESCQVAQCFTSQVLGSAQPIAFSGAEANQIANAFADSGYSVRALVEAIVTNRAFFR